MKLSNEEKALLSAKLLYFALTFPKGQMFFNYSGHVELIEIEYWPDKWDSETEIYERKRFYLDQLTEEKIQELNQWKDSLLNDLISSDV